MLKAVEWFLSAPVFEDDEEKTRAARIFNAISLSITAFLALIAIGLAFIFIKKTGVAATLFLLLSLLLISRALAHRGRIRLASVLLVSGIWVVFTVNVWLSGGVNSVMTGSYIAVTVLAGILLGPRTAVAVAVSSAAAALGMTVLDSIGYPPPHYYPLPPTQSLVVLICGLVLTVPAVSLAVQGFADALGTARKEIREREEADKALPLSERSYRQLVENLNDVIFAMDPRGVVTYVNPAVERMLGYRPSEILGRDFSSLVRQEDLPEVAKTFQDVLENRLYPSDYQFRAKSGDYRWLRTSSRPILKGDKVLGILGVAVDITERKRVEQSIEHLNRLRRFIRQVNQSTLPEKKPNRLIEDACKLLVDDQGYEYARIIVTDEADVPRYFAQAGMGEAFRPLEEKLNRGELPPCCEHARFQEDVYLVTDRRKVCRLCPLPAGCSSSGSMCIRMKDAEKAYGYLAVSEPQGNALDEDELSLFAELGGDIAVTLRHIELAEQATISSEALRLTEGKYRRLVESVSDVIYEIDSHGIISYVSPAVRTMMGYEPEELMGKPRAEFVYPEDRELMTRAFEDLKEGVARLMEWRVMGKSGDMRWLQTLPKAALKEERFDGVRGTAIDVTERKKAEETQQKRVIALTRPLDDPAGIHLSDLFDIADLQRIQDVFAAATGVASLITAPDGTPITKPSNFCRLCRELIRQTDKGMAKGTRSDAVIGRYNPSGPIVQECLSSGLWNAGASITVGGKHIANWLIGQVRNEELDIDRIREYAYEIEADPEEFAKALAEVPIMAKEQFEKVAGALFCFANELSTKAYQNVQQARFIAERQKAEAMRTRLVTAIEQAVEGVVITDANGTIQYVNPALEKMTGYDSKELIGETPRVVKSGEHDQAFYRHLWETIARGKVWTGQFVNKRKAGRLYHEDATISPVRDASGKIVNFVGVKRDVTEHLELSKQLQQALKMEAVGMLAGGVAHDFNNILQVALGYSELILGDEGLPKRYRADLRKIHESARRGADLVQRLLTFSRKTEIKTQPLNLNRRITELRKMLERTIPKMIDIRLSLGEDLATINADPTQIDQVLMNLAVNARDAMGDGGKLTIETANIILDEEYARSHLDAKPGNYVLLTITDTGSGMDKDTLEHIFEPFYTTKGVGEGTGLGLATVHGIVKHHGGYIRCYSEPGEGTTFKIYFPALISEEEKEETTVREMPRGGSETVLIVDDEEFIRDLGSRILTNAGYNVVTASEGTEALQVYQARRHEIALVLLDLVMPGIGGKQCLEGLLGIDSSVKVVIASGYSADGPTKEALAAGAKGFVDKPYDMSQMLEVLRGVLDAD